jgi:hypothetical protein
MILSNCSCKLHYYIACLYTYEGRPDCEGNIAGFLLNILLLFHTAEEVNFIGFEVFVAVIMKSTTFCLYIWGRTISQLSNRQESDSKQSKDLRFLQR